MKLFSLLIGILLLIGCASTPQSRLIHSASKSLPTKIELSDTPFFAQDKYQCGPAALATVLQSKGILVNPEDLVSKVYLPARKGSLQIEMLATARSYGMLSYQLDSKLLHLFKEVSAGNPVLILQNLSFNFYPRWHYAVVVGYDMDKEIVILRSGKNKRRITSFKVFERTWQRSNHWAQVIVPVGQIPKTATALRYLKSAYSFEELQMFDVAHTAYKQATLQWPETNETWMTYGNMCYQTGDINTAVMAFHNAADNDPYSADPWNNLAYALNSQGCLKQSIAALQCGLKYSPNDENLKNSYNELLSNTDNKVSNSCIEINCD